MIGIPSDEGDERREKGDNPESVGSTSHGTVACTHEEPDFKAGESEWGDDGGFFGKRRKGEESRGENLIFFSRLEIEREAPEGKGCGKDVCVGKGALRKPDWVDRCEHGSGNRSRCIEQRASELKDGDESGRCNHDDKSAGSANNEP